MRIGILLFVFTINCFASPVWYEERQYKNNNSIYFGYGEGDTSAQARKNALSEISDTIEIKVASTFLSVNKQYSDDSERYVKALIKTKSQAVLKNAVIVKEEKSWGKYYLVVKYVEPAPDWFRKRDIDYFLFSTLGYGSGVDEKSALQAAFYDLAAQLSVKIEGGLSIEEKVENGESTRTSSFQTKTSVDLQINQAKVIKTQKKGNEYFTVVGYQMKPKEVCVNAQNPFLTSSPLIKDANTFTNCQYDYELRYQADAWYLSYKSILERVGEQSFDKLFQTVKNKNIVLTSKKQTYVEGELFSLNILSRVSGYLSLIVVYEDGRVGVLLKNYYLNRNENIVFPDTLESLEMEAGLNESNKATKDLYFAFVSKDKFDLSLFEEQGNVEVGKNEFRFGEVIELCRGDEFTTLLLRTVPR